jgi:hypothetical protein
VNIRERLEAYAAECRWALARGDARPGLPDDVHAELKAMRSRGERADLTGADLRWADLTGADLTGAHLTGADLRWADLTGADLRCAGLRCALLTGADLTGADLTGAGLRIASLCFGGWPVTVTPEHTAIGCQKHPNAEWLRWTPEDVAAMHADASSWWARHREAVCAVIRDVMQPVGGGQP